MITVEDLLTAFASAYDAWLDPDAERKNPVPEYAALIRQAVNYENDTLGRGTCTMLRLSDCTCQYMHRYACSECGEQNEQLTVMGESEPPNYCPNCGARVVER